MNKAILATLAFVLAAPAASAHHWEDDHATPRVGDSTCSFTETSTCTAEYLCIGGSPPQIVDTALHCAGRASSEAAPTADSAVDFVLIFIEDQAEATENYPDLLNQETAEERGVVNDQLCNVVWSLFCSVPIALPEHIPIDDPLT